jgi:hypothetical protein
MSIIEYFIKTYGKIKLIFIATNVSLLFFEIKISLETKDIIIL